MTEGDLELAEHAFRLCEQLLRIDTTNPPGNELPAAELLAEELDVSDVPVRIQDVDQSNSANAFAGAGSVRSSAGT